MQVKAARKAESMTNGWESNPIANRSRQRIVMVSHDAGVGSSNLLKWWANAPSTCNSKCLGDQSQTIHMQPANALVVSPVGGWAYRGNAPFKVHIDNSLYN
jgi:hypothetical protein